MNVQVETSTAVSASKSKKLTAGPSASALQRAKNLLERTTTGARTESAKAFELRVFANKSVEDAAAYLLALVNDDTAAHSDRIQAAKVIIERRFGKPRQALDVTAQTDLAVTFVYGKKPVDSPQVVVDAEFREKPDTNGSEQA